MLTITRFDFDFSYGLDLAEGPRAAFLAIVKLADTFHASGDADACGSC